MPEPFPIGVDEVAGEWLGGGDDRGAVGLEDSIELPPHEVEVRADVPVAGGDTVGRVREDGVAGAVGDSPDAGFVVFEEDMVEEVGRQHEKSLALYLTLVKYLQHKRRENDRKAGLSFLRTSRKGSRHLLIVFNPYQFRDIVPEAFRDLEIFVAYFIRDRRRS